jgi:hypothetical protein
MKVKSSTMMTNLEWLQMVSIQLLLDYMMDPSNNHSHMPWTQLLMISEPELLDQLTKLWLIRLSTTQMAKDLAPLLHAS